MKRFYESCFYTGEESEFLSASDYCTECIGVHSMCPKCRSAYHSAHIIE